LRLRASLRRLALEGFAAAALESYRWMERHVLSSGSLLGDNGSLFSVSSPGDGGKPFLYAGFATIK
jgi:hypothetical protein